MKGFFLIFFLFFSFHYSFSATIDIRIVIDNGTLGLPGAASTSVKTFKQTPVGVATSDILVWTTIDDINLRVVNQDTISHNFVIEGLYDFGIIAPGDSTEQNISIGIEGVYRYLDNSNSPYQEYLGLSGIIHVKAPADNIPYFYWDIHEFQLSLNNDIIIGNTPALNDYNPAYFTLNGRSAPDINNDTVARVIGNTGNEFRIVIMNNGLSIHSMHFHGYHLSIEEDSNSSITIGRSKDTFPVKPGNHLLLSCTPDKPGEYPVHDHNLVAVTGGGEYANGMFITMLISP